MCEHPVYSQFPHKSIDIVYGWCGVGVLILHCVGPPDEDDLKSAVLDRAPPPDIVDIKPANMEELTEVITAAECHPHQCNVFVYSSSKGTIRLCDMRAAALCDRQSKCKSIISLGVKLYRNVIVLDRIEQYMLLLANPANPVIKTQLEIRERS